MDTVGVALWVLRSVVVSVVLLLSLSLGGISTVERKGDWWHDPLVA